MSLKQFKQTMALDGWKRHSFTIRGEGKRYYWSKGQTVYYPDGELRHKYDYNRPSKKTDNWQDMLRKGNTPLALF